MELASVLYRKATEADFLSIATLHADSWRAHYRDAYRDEFLDGHVLADRIEVWQARLSTPPANQFVFLAEDEREVVGFVCAYGREDPGWGTLLDNLHVRPECQGRGVGARLVAAVGGWCREQYPDCGVFLWVLEQNVEAQRFYRRLGAVDRGGRLSVPPGGGQISGRRYVWNSPADLPQVAVPRP